MEHLKYQLENIHDDIIYVNDQVNDMIPKLAPGNKDRMNYKNKELCGEISMMNEKFMNMQHANANLKSENRYIKQ